MAMATPETRPDHVEAVVSSRRTNLLVDSQRPVPDALVDRLIAAATWAPNHKRTWPWRFTVLTGASRAVLGERMSVTASGFGAPEAQVLKLRTKYLRSPTVVLVWVRTDAADEVRRREDRDATAAAVQNMLLTATAHDLASYWGTVPDPLVATVRDVAGVGPEHDLVALVYLGWPTGSVAVPPRPAPVVDRLT